MATRYVSNNPAGSNTSPYDTLAKAATTFATAITGAAAGDVFAFSNLHSEAIAAPTTYTLPGTAASPNQMYSFDNTQTTISATNLLSGATLSTTGANSLSFAGSCSECVGFVLAAGSGSTNVQLNIGSSVGAVWRLFNCALQKLGTTGSPQAIHLGSAGNACYTELHNTTVQFGSLGDGVRVGGPTKWLNTPNAIQGTAPTTLISQDGSPSLFCEGVDFSGASGTTIVGTNIQNLVQLKDNKLPASGTTMATPTSPAGSLLYTSRCDSAGTNYKFNAVGYSGTESAETTVTRVGGASTPNGTSFSAKIVTTANAQWTVPFEALPLTAWNTLVGSARVVTIYGTINAGAVPNNDDIWIEVEYLKDSGDPLGGYVNSTKANNLAAGTAVSVDNSSTWNGGGSGAGWSPFKLTATLTAQQTGPLTVRVYAGKASTTYYVDPHVYQS